MGPDSNQYVGAGQGAIGGAASGAYLGTAVGGPGFGTAMGAGAGAVAGGIMGWMGSNQKGYQLPWDQYNSRLNQIAAYNTNLSGATSQYAQALGSLQQTTFDLYEPDAAARFNAHGLAIDSGAFAADLSRTGAGLTASGMASVASQNIKNVSDVNSQYENAWAAMFGASDRSSQAGFNNANQIMAGLGQAAVGVGKLGRALSTKTPDPGSYSDRVAPGNPFSGSYSGSTQDPWGGTNPYGSSLGV